jgi:solute carrier family 25 uncoupling protein 8/9
MADNFTTHCLCGFSAGFVACVFASPADVLKTRMMNARVPYKGVGDAAWQMMSNEGPLSFYKGFVANFTRLGIWNIVLFVTLE